MLDKIFEVKLVPKDKEASIKYIIVRVDDPVNIDDMDKCIDFLEKQFPQYMPEHAISGYRRS